MLNIESINVKGAKVAEEILSNLPSLNRALPSLELEHVRALIRVEADGKHRMTTLQRLIARFNVLEARENEKELMQYVVRKHK
jgi:hypothetical protein